MSSSIEYLIQLHHNGVIFVDDLRKGIRALGMCLRLRLRRLRRLHRLRRLRHRRRGCHQKSVLSATNRKKKNAKNKNMHI